MAFNLENVVPWGRNLDEYTLMFKLSNSDMKKKIAGFGDGPASFNYEATEKGYSVTSFDIIYQFSKGALERRIEEVRSIVMEQMKSNMDNYIWDTIGSLEDLENIRMSAMRKFLLDYEKGKADNRYIYHQLPNRLSFEEDEFDIALSSHFLLMYTGLGYDFHIEAISEMLRVCKEVRIFPIVDLDSKESELVQKVIEYFKEKYSVEIINTEYQFQKGGNKLLVIKK